VQVGAVAGGDDLGVGKVEHLEPGWEIGVSNPAGSLGQGVNLVPHGRQDRAPFCRIENRPVDDLPRLGVEDDGAAGITSDADDPRAVRRPHGGEGLAAGNGGHTADAVQALPLRPRRMGSGDVHLVHGVGLGVLGPIPVACHEVGGGGRLRDIFFLDRTNWRRRKSCASNLSIGPQAVHSCCLDSEPIKAQERVLSRKAEL
jgi:hypothetical protein